MLRTIFLAAVLAALFAIPSAAQNFAEGEILGEIEFGRIAGADGETRLSDFRGRVVLACWYQDVFSGMAAAESAVKLAEKYAAKGLAVILMATSDWKDAGGTEERAFLHRAYKDHAALVAANAQVPIAFAGDPPFFFVVDAEGRLALSGPYKTKGSQIPGAVKKALAARKRGWGENDLQRRVRQAAYVKDRIGEAWDAIGAVDDQPLRDEVQGLVKRRADMIGRLISAGEFARARHSLDAAIESAGWRESMREPLQARIDELEAKDAKAAVAADEKLEKLTASLARGKSGAGLVAKLEKEVEASAARVHAAELLALARALL